MTKPWEKEYQTHPMDMRVLVEKDPNGEGDGWLAVADLRVPLGECRDVGAFFAASSDMVMALKALLVSGVNARWIDDETGKVVNVRKLAESALAKAGVPLP